MNTTTTKNPFIYGRPVRQTEFIGREAELRTLFNRLANGESTAIAGEAHSGKSSLLIKLADKDVQKVYLGVDASRLIVFSLDLHSISIDYTPQKFWHDILTHLREEIGNTAANKLLKNINGKNYDRRTLEKIITQLSDENLCLVLLLDEFERLLSHKNFSDASFFGLLRSLSSRIGGLALVTASRLGVAKLDELGRGLLNTGSPFFNNMIEVRLPPFSYVQVEELLRHADASFSPTHQRFIHSIAGGNPFLLQAMAATLFEAQNRENLDEVAESFFERIYFHFEDLWNSMDDYTRTTSVILSLMELGGLALGKEFSFGEIENVASFGPELRKLAKLGLAERIDKGWKFDVEHFLVWHGEKWAVSSQAFIWWIRDVAISENRNMPIYSDWLNRKQYKTLLTEEQWNKLISTISKVPEIATRGIGKFAQILFEEIRRKSI